MNRRKLLKSGLAAGIIGATNLTTNAVAPETNHYYELRTYQLRNDIHPARIQAFFKDHFMPMAKRQEIGPVGCFTIASGQNAPANYNSLFDVFTAHKIIFAVTNKMNLSRKSSLHFFLYFQLFSKTIII